MAPSNNGAVNATMLEVLSLALYVCLKVYVHRGSGLTETLWHGMY